MKNKILYLVIGICCIGLTACTHDSDEPTSVIKNEISRSTITVERTVTLTTPGTLQEELEKLIDNESTLQKLILVGPYNGKDVQYWKTTLSNLIEFDLKEAIPTQSEGEDYEYLDPYGNIMYQNDNVIGPHSFSFMTNLESIVLPDCVTTIDYEACNGCKKLSSVVFGSQNQYLNSQVFQDCGFTTFTIPNSIIQLGYGCFQNCLELKEVNLLANITSISGATFNGCKKLDTITLSSTIKEVNSDAFYGCISLKSFPFSQINKIGHSAFHSSGIEEADLSNVTDFSNASWSFRLCESLKKVILPNNATYLANTMFWGCTSLKEINIPSTLETINDELLGGCGFTEITIPATVKHIGSNAFASNHLLEKVVFSGDIESIGSRCFEYCDKLESVTLPTQIKELPERFLSGCSSLKNIQLPSGLEIIGNDAFLDSGLETVDIPSSVTTIGYSAFRNTPLKYIHVPATVTSITGNIISWCRNLEYIIWDSPVELVDPDDVNPNCYVYLANENITCGSNWKNVITNIDGEYVAESITLCEGGQRDNANMSYSVPKEFRAKKITYERMFGDYDWPDKNITYPGESSGWQTIVLPFTPTKIEHETKGEIAPFNSGIEDAKPFWLRELTTEGFEDRTIIEPDKAYIIAMPNHDSYLDEYRLYGKIIFSAENVTLKSTFDETTQAEMIYPASEGPEYDLQPTYNYVKHGPLIYALNVTYRINNYYYGSVFARSSSDVYAFEAYVKPGGRLARSAFGIDTSSSNTRSAKEKNTTGIPQIGDM